MAIPTDIQHDISERQAAPPSTHPLDPLFAAELNDAVQILAREKYLTANVRIASINLIEPAKSLVEKHKAGAPFERKALAVLLDRGKRASYEAVVDLPGKSVTSITQLPSDVQPSVMLDEFGECEEAVRRSPMFQVALQKRGVTDADLVMVDPWSAGLYGTELPEEKGVRRLRALCFLRAEPKDNGYARPIDSMVVVVDLYKMEVIRIEEYPIAPLPPEPGNWAREYIPNVRQDLKPVDIVQPEGPSFTVEGNQVEWQKWKFRVGFTSREGLVLHTISYNDDGVERPILYRASICEMVVPYGDPGEQYYRKNAFDIGEYGLGMLANSLALGCDCLGVIHYFDFPLVDSHGNVTPLKNAVCLHEEDYGILWKHTDWRTGQSEVRRSRRLSVSFIATVGNYEYGFYWYFYQDGSIQCEIKLTGILNTTALPPGERSKYGTEIAPQLNAPFH
jgi:primary-amine oxidase